MDKKITGILSYITIIGWIVAYVAGDKDGAKHHLNQGLVCGVLQILLWAIGGLVGIVLGWIPLVGSLIGWIFAGLGFAVILVQIYGVVLAATDNDSSIPVIGSIKLLK